MPAEPRAGRDALVHLSASLATRDAAVVRAAMEHCIGEAEPVRVEEVILQAHLFIGFPDALNALSLWREVSGWSPPPPSGEDATEWQARGPAVCAAVYGSNYGKLRLNVQGLHPDLDTWMVTGGYGRVIGRPGLDLATRELCIAALLAVWNVPRQLHSHLRGALNVGASVAEVERAMEIACGMLPAGRKEEVRKLWREIRARAEGELAPQAAHPGGAAPHAIGIRAGGQPAEARDGRVS